MPSQRTSLETHSHRVRARLTDKPSSISAVLDVALDDLLPESGGPLSRESADRLWVEFERLIDQFQRDVAALVAEAVFAGTLATPVRRSSGRRTQGRTAARVLKLRDPRG